jgi:hypothetical protein
VTATPNPESAAHNITALIGRIRGIAAAMAAGETVHPDALDLALDALVAAVRHHDAEVVRAIDPIEIALAGQYAGGDIACTLGSATRTDVPSEVEVRYDDGLTVRVAGFSVTTDAATGTVVVEGFITSRTGQPHSGDAVRLAYVGIPGRGALADIEARVDLFTRLEVLNIRIRTTIRPEENR